MESWIPILLSWKHCPTSYSKNFSCVVGEFTTYNKKIAKSTALPPSVILDECNLESNLRHAVLQPNVQPVCQPCCHLKDVCCLCFCCVQFILLSSTHIPQKSGQLVLLIFSKDCCFNIVAGTNCYKLVFISVFL